MKKFKFFLLVMLCFFLVFGYSYFVSPLVGDEIWNYGFGYNLAKGLIPYRDFNLIVPPLYPFLSSIFIVIFGSHLWSVHILNAILILVLSYIVYKKLGKRFFLFLPILLFYIDPGYNFLLVFFMIVFLFLLDMEFKYKEIILGILCGILFLTKQTVGVCLLIPCVYYSKNRVKSILGYLFPILICFLYLIYYDAFFQFIDYCFLGMFEFCSSNSLYLFLPIEILVILILGIKLVRSRFRNQKLFYLLMYQIVAIPIVDGKHFFTAFVPVFYYLLEVVSIKKYQFKYYLIMVWFALICQVIMFYETVDHLFWVRDRDSFLYGRLMDRITFEVIEEVGDYVVSVENDYDNIYLFTWYSYIIKLNSKLPIFKFDLINNGNMGYHGSKRYIDEFSKKCEEESCLFLVETSDSFHQTNEEIVDYVVTHYTKIKEIQFFSVYVNEEK